jgi:N-acetylglucosaminyldiphosphoundecaprenol N-acetyl-beta-D-mannosaminyltransferase
VFPTSNSTSSRPVIAPTAPKNERVLAVVATGVGDVADGSNHSSGEYVATYIHERSAERIGAKFQLLGVKIDAVQIPDVISRMCDWITQHSTTRYITVTGMHGVMEAHHSAKFRTVLDDADMIVPDGMPLVWISRLRGCGLQRRVYGPELMLRFCQETAGHGYRHFIYGGDAGVPEQLAARLEVLCPGIRIVGMHAPPFRPLTSEEDAAAVDMVNRAAPDVLWVGLGTPKQDRWMHEHRDRLRVPVMVGVGAAFDFLAERKKQAPAWIQEHGLEWLFRLLQEPRRLWKRYLVDGPEFVALSVLELLGLRRFD